MDHAAAPPFGQGSNKRVPRLDKTKLAEEKQTRLLAKLTGRRKETIIEEKKKAIKRGRGTKREEELDYNPVGGPPEAQNGRRFRRREEAWCDQHAWSMEPRWRPGLGRGNVRTKPLGWLRPVPRRLHYWTRTNVCALLSATKIKNGPNAGGCGQLFVKARNEERGTGRESWACRACCAVKIQAVSSHGHGDG